MLCFEKYLLFHPNGFLRKMNNFATENISGQGILHDEDVSLFAE